MTARCICVARHWFECIREAVIGESKIIYLESNYKFFECSRGGGEVRRFWDSRGCLQLHICSRLLNLELFNCFRLHPQRSQFLVFGSVRGRCMCLMHLCFLMHRCFLARATCKCQHQWLVSVRRRIHACHVPRALDCLPWNVRISDFHQHLWLAKWSHAHSAHLLSSPQSPRCGISID